MVIAIAATLLISCSRNPGSIPKENDKEDTAKLLLQYDKNPSEEVTLLDPKPESGSYWTDGSAFKVWEHKSGYGQGVPIVIVGECYSYEDNKDNGLWETTAKMMASAFLKNDIIKNFRNYFDIYVVVAESPVSGIQDGNNGGTPGKFGTTTTAGCNFDAANAFTVQAIPALGPVFNRSWMVVFNGEAGGWAQFGMPAGNCGMAWYSAAEGNVSKYWMMHEFCGHGFASLADEYPGGDAAYDWNWQSWNMVENVSNTNDLSKVPWKNFIGKTGYEEIGAYQVQDGVWRPEIHSIMVDNANDDYYYNAMSRWMIYRRIYDGTKFYDQDSDPNSPTGKPRIYQSGELDTLFNDFLEFDKLYNNK
ncbi:hypothetical protein A8C56_09680 [Niabella ginsenosidivorans]|uniref:Uncharacterized protein n=2 Tax=Niabella ginsenosidivorans TaxID=1176587 RepID=A0A1A9I0R6_9BACT|nr:hypothetical protein A8C56_09680 [Niabella ginsenosidivorans]